MFGRLFLWLVSLLFWRSTLSNVNWFQNEYKVLLKCIIWLYTFYLSFLRILDNNVISLFSNVNCKWKLLKSILFDFDFKGLSINWRLIIERDAFSNYLFFFNIIWLNCDCYFKNKSKCGFKVQLVAQLKSLRLKTNYFWFLFKVGCN